MTHLKASIAQEILDSAIEVRESNKTTRENRVKETALKFKEKQKNKRIEFPTMSFPTLTRQTIESWHRCSNLPTEYFGLAILSAASTLIGNKVKVKVNHQWSESPMIYGAILGPNGIGKSAVWDYALSPVTNIQNENNRELVDRLQEYKEELGERSMSKRSTGDLEEPRERLVMVENTTMEYLYEAMWYNPNGLLLHRDELKGWLMSMNQYRAGDDLQVFLEIWNNKTKSRRIKSNSYYIERTFLGILGAIQPSLIRSLATGENVANGLFQRFLYAYPYYFSRGEYNESEPDPGIQNRYINYMRYLHDMPSKIVVPQSKYDKPGFEYITIEMTPEAKREWIKHHNYISSAYNEQEDENAAGVISKQDRYCARLALVIRFIRLAEVNHKYDEISVKPEEVQAQWIGEADDLNKIKVELEDMQAARALSNYFQFQSLRILDKIGNPAQSLPLNKQIIYKSLPDEFSRQEAIDVLNQLTKEIEGFEMSERSLFRMLNNEDGEIFHKMRRGYYGKRWEM